TIEEYYKSERVNNKDWYFQDENFLKVRELKFKKDKARKRDNFYTENTIKVNDISIRFYNSRLNKLIDMFKSLNYIVGKETLKDLLKDNKLSINEIYFSVIFNYIT